MNSRAAAVSLVAVAGALRPAHVRAQGDSLSEVARRAAAATVVLVMLDKGGDALGYGSGFVVSNSGDVMTNLHVIVEGARLKVITSDSAEFDVVKVLASGEGRIDLAIVSTNLSAGRVKPLALAHSVPKVGDWVAAVGAPLEPGLHGTITPGQFSGVRDSPPFGRVLQISSITYPGSSGGPVVSSSGRVVGIVVGGSPTAPGITYAVPAYFADSLVSINKELAAWQAEVWLRRARIADSLVEAGSRAGGCRKSLPYLAAAADSDPYLYRTWWMLATCYEDEAQYEDGIDAITKALVLVSERTTRAYYLGILARLYVESSRYEEAIAAYRDAILTEPDEVTCSYSDFRCPSVAREKDTLYTQLADVYIHLERYQHALEALRSLVQYDETHGPFGIGSEPQPSPKTYVKIAEIFRRLGVPDSVRAWVRRCKDTAHRQHIDPEAQCRLPS